MIHSPDDPLRTYLQQWFPEFSYRSGDDRFFQSLQDEFPGLSLLAEMKAFHAWCLDRPQTKPISYRLSFRKWLTRAHGPF